MPCLKFKTAEIGHLENREVAISQRKSSDLDEIGYTTADLKVCDSHVIKYENFQKFNVADGHHFKNCFWP